MKSILTRLISLLFIVIMSLSCMKQHDPEPEKVETKGIVSFAKINVSVDLSTKDEQTTKVTGVLDPEKFHVTLVSKKDNSVIGQWIKAEMPAQLEIFSGEYEIRCTSLLTYKAAEWEQPVYSGAQTFKVAEGATTTVDNIVCKLANMSVKVVYGEQLIADMSTYQVAVTNNRGILTYTSSETRKGYFDTGVLVASLKGTRKDGTAITKVLTISGGTAGDAHVIKFDVNTKGTAVIGITVDLTVNDKVVNVEIEDDGTIVDPDPDPDPTPDPDPDPDPQPQQPSVAGVGFDISQTMTFPSGTIKTVDVKVLAPNGGIKTLDVIIDSPTLGPLLDGLGIPTNLDLVTPTSDVKKLLQELKLIGTEPVGGKTEFQFSIGSFMPLLPIGTHKFKVVLVDGGGVKVAETLTIIVT